MSNIQCTGVSEGGKIQGVFSALNIFFFFPITTILCNSFFSGKVFESLVGFLFLAWTRGCDYLKEGRGGHYTADKCSGCGNFGSALAYC